MLWAFFLLLIGKLMNRRKALVYSNEILRLWSRVWGFLIGLRFRQTGWKNEYGQTPMVMVTNHNSYLDTVVSYVNIHAAFRTLAKRELLKLPIMGFIFKTSGIMVDRSSPESRKQSFERMVEGVSLGESLLIYPEGTQNRTQEPMQQFYDGAFRLAVKMQVPVLPIVTIGTRRIMPQAKLGKMWPGTVSQLFLEPVPTVGLGEDDIPALIERIRNAMIAKQAELDPKYPG
ncbi:MAG: lysophospholipid acyltransferase family protein [Bacteroidia bacterium]